MKIKICGVKDIDTAKKVCEYGADYIGFVFAKSKRQVTVEKAKEISQQIGKSIKKVGVFQNESAKEIIRIADYCDLDIIQLHGCETLDSHKCEQELIRSISLDFNDSKINILKKFNKINRSYNHILFDTKLGKTEGGSGVAFNWDKISDISLKENKCFLAGGININNVEDAIKRVSPYAIDISSGVESNGIKDHIKIKEFIDFVRGL